MKSATGKRDRPPDDSDQSKSLEILQSDLAASENCDLQHKRRRTSVSQSLTQMVLASPLYINGRAAVRPDSFEVRLGVWKDSHRPRRVVTGHLSAGGTARFTIRNVSTDDVWILPRSGTRSADLAFDLQWGHATSMIEWNEKAGRMANRSLARLEEYLFSELVLNNSMIALWSSTTSTKQDELLTSICKYVSKPRDDAFVKLTLSPSELEILARSTLSIVAI